MSPRSAKPAIVNFASRVIVLIRFRSAIAERERNPCLRALILPNGGPVLAPPCNRHRPLRPAIHLYQKRRGAGRGAQNIAGELKMRAERKLGLLLETTDRAKAGDNHWSLMV